MAIKQNVTRRSFMKTSAALASVTIVPRHVLGGPAYIPPSDKINVAFIGTGTQGLRILMDALRRPELHVQAVCDANRDSQDYPEWFKHELRTKIRTFLEKPTWGEGNSGCRAGREVGREVVDGFYELTYGRSKSACSAYEDYRDLLENENDLDGVFILTPEHLHATIAVAAMRKGKHVITHKPISNVLSEVRFAADVAENTKLATHLFCAADKQTTPLLSEWIWGNAIGQVREVHNWTTRPFWPQGMTAYPLETPPVPDGLNWQLWQGPVPNRAYHPDYTHARFRGWIDYGTGALGDMGHYSFYQLFKIMKLEAPVSVEASRSVYWAIEDGHWSKQVNKVSYPRASIIQWEFPQRGSLAAMKLIWYDGGMRPPIPDELEADGRKMPDEGLLFVGDKGKILAGFSGDSPRLIPEAAMKSFQRPPKSLPRPKDEIDQWIHSCRGEARSDARFEVARAINETICLGTIALRSAEKLYWDADNMKFFEPSHLHRNSASKNVAQNSDVNDLLYRTYRPGWELI